ncbi:MAG: 2-oxo acid dehydrogenase subunit E2 [Hydrogenophaga sp.]|uniref:dihydrolipoamide acetyltransferase family protein n=1 Tax=Hydrogenophaga sp. TaxID=1904254 RepID=UPI0025C3D739|nr:dihydrolipoamide acetyltransferase family protein [Hydrogenophaga sp.]MBT9550353.1 2-oxo acid dehydrogenase subunit E2 [Hydrogenophaga sp.]
MTSADALAQAPAPALLPLKGLRGAIARNMSAGWLAPRVAMAAEVDMTRCLEQVARHAVSGDAARPTVTAWVLRAVAQALRQHPAMNALMREGGIERVPSIHLGLAVAIPEGLSVPVIRDAEGKSVMALAGEVRALATGAKAGSLPPRAYQGGTFTVTNLGMTGIDWFTPILNPPQVGIIGVSRVAQRPVVRDGQLAVAPMTTLTLVFDHRAVDGYPAAQFLASVRERLESAEGQ